MERKRKLDDSSKLEKLNKKLKHVDNQIAKYMKIKEQVKNQIWHQDITQHISDWAQLCDKVQQFLFNQPRAIIDKLHFDFTHYQDDNSYDLEWSCPGISIELQATYDSTNQSLDNDPEMMVQDLCYVDDHKKPCECKLCRVHTRVNRKALEESLVLTSGNDLFDLVTGNDLLRPLHSRLILDTENNLILNAQLYEENVNFLFLTDDEWDQLLVDGFNPWFIVTCCVVGQYMEWAENDSENKSDDDGRFKFQLCKF